MVSSSDLPGSFRNVLDLFRDGVLVVDPSGAVSWGNASALAAFGCGSAELSGRILSDLIPEAGTKKGTAFGELRVVESEVRRPDGGRFHAEVTGRVLSDGGCLAVVRDMTSDRDSGRRLSESRDLYRALAETPALGFLLTDLHGRVLDANAAYSGMSGHSVERLRTLRVWDLEASETADEVEAHLGRLRLAGFDRFRTTHRRADGSSYPVEVVVTLRTDLHGGRCFAFVEDVTEKQVREAQLRIADLVLSSMEQAVAVTDASNRIVAVNPALTRITGYELEDLAGQTPKVFSSGRHDREFYRRMWETLLSEDRWEGEIWDRRKNGEVYAKWLSIRAVRDAKGSVANYVSMFSDITDQMRAQETIRRQAHFCSLTDLPNRRLFNERLSGELAEALKLGSGFALLFLDLDRFKEVNDTLGHGSGDELLRETARRLSLMAGPSDTVARLGGDEFTLLVPNAFPGPSSEAFLSGVVEAFAPPFRLGSETVRVTPSVGVAFFPYDGVDEQSLMMNADRAMYAAKAAGRNGWRRHEAGGAEPPEAEGLARLRLEAELRQALDHGELRVFYQPIVDLRTGRIAKAEALVRWQHPKRGLLLPGEFIGLAEETGLVVELGEQVFEAAAAQSGDWRKRFDPDFSVGVNRSPKHFGRKEEGVGWVERLESMGLPGSALTVEITEGSLMESGPAVREKIAKLRGFGVEVSLDDFGTGYSSLSYLRSFELDAIKVDQSFVRTMVRGSPDHALVEAIVAMAKKLGLKVVAEGVETGEQLEILREVGCDLAQGYLFSRPVPVVEFETLLAAGAVDLDALSSGG